MALNKKIVMSNGLPLEYHRIALVSIEPNRKVTILRHSYMNEEARQYEKDYAAGKIEGEPQFPYVAHEYVNMNYAEAIEALRDGAMEGAYALLKKHRPEFADAVDLLDSAEKTCCLVRCCLYDEEGVEGYECDECGFNEIHDFSEPLPDRCPRCDLPVATDY